MTRSGDLTFAERLSRRAAILRRLRAFFDDRGFCEVETPLLGVEVIPELHIEPIPVEAETQTSQLRWLQPSPEMAMKRLLADGLRAIYQVTRSFREGERGRLHHPEFTLVEWYRAGDDLAAGMELLAALVRDLLCVNEVRKTTYHDAFVRWTGVAPHAASCSELVEAAGRLGIVVPIGMPTNDRDQWLNLLLATSVEPQLGRESPELLYDYPASQAALAELAFRADLKGVDGTAGIWAAERFELYVGGVELANGYHELIEPCALRDRLVAVNAQRASDGRRTLPLPEQLLETMRNPGLPPCAGCALGLDRLVMVALGADAIHEVCARPGLESPSVGQA